MDKIVELINDFMPDPEVNEVAIFCVSRYALAESAEQGVSTKRTEVSVSPEQVKLVLQYDSNMARNKFYTENYGILKLLLAQEEIFLNSRSYHLARSKENLATSGRVVRDLTVNRLGILTMIVLLDSGAEKAKKFDFMLRGLITLTDAENEYFKKYPEIN